VAAGAVFSIVGATSTLNANFIGGVFTALTLAAVPPNFDSLTPSNVLSYMRVRYTKPAIANILDGIAMTMPLPQDMNLVTRFTSQNHPNLGKVP